jgi:Rieske Fe-S protein
MWLGPVRIGKSDKGKNRPDPQHLFDTAAIPTLKNDQNKNKIFCSCLKDVYASKRRFHCLFISFKGIFDISNQK